MIKRIACRAALATAMIGTLAMAQAASATTFAFDFTNKGSYEASTTGAVTGAAAAAQTFSSTAHGSNLSVKVTAWHLNDPNSNALMTDSISAAKLGYWSGGGIGVLFGNDNGWDGTHQIDNTGGGADFVMLQFDQDVTLSGISRNAYSMSRAGVSCCSAQAQFWADTSNFLGAPSSSANVQLQNYSLAESSLRSIDTRGNLNLNSQASVWLVSAGVNRNSDGFKLSGLTVSTAGAVPEPSTWAMMLSGFGMVGVAIRRRKKVALANA